MRYSGSTTFKKAGFTLLEVMLVLLLMGLAAGYVMFNAFGASKSDLLKSQAQRLQVIVDMASDFAVLNQQQLGVRCDFALARGSRLIAVYASAACPSLTRVVLLLRRGIPHVIVLQAQVSQHLCIVGYGVEEPQHHVQGASMALQPHKVRPNRARARA